MTDILDPPMISPAVPTTSDLADEILMLREEIDILRRQIVGAPVERMIEGFVHPAVLEEHLARYQFAGRFLSGSVLDMACGAGYGSNCLSSFEAVASVTGVDIDPRVVRYAALKYVHPRIKFECRNACEHWTAEKFDGIASFETIEHVPAPDRMLESVVAMLATNGCFVVSTPIRRSGKLADRPSWDFHEREWSSKEFTQLLRLYFDEVEVYGQRWTIRQDFGFIHVGKRVAHRLMRAAGVSDSLRQSLESEVLSPGDAPANWVLPTPAVTVCVCRGGHPAADTARVRQLSYGDLPG